MTIREQALAMLTMCQLGEITLSARAGGFLGQIVADPSPFTEKQADWFAKLLKRAGLSEGDER